MDDANESRSIAFMSFKTKAGAPNNLDDVKKVLENIAKTNGGKITPPMVVDEAVNPKSPLHDHFEWDDSEAAVKWRLEQARSLIASVRVTYVQGEEKSTVRAFVHVPLKNEDFYAETHKAMKNADWRQAILDRALVELQTVERKYEHLQELAEIWTTVGQVRKKLNKTR